MVLEFVQSEKGKPKLLDKGYLFVKDKSKQNGITFWKCEKFASGCRARIHATQDEVQKRIGEHANHAADAAKVNAVKVVNAIKERASTSQDSGHQIVAAASIGLSQAVAAKLPSADNLKRTIRNIRQGQNAPPPNPPSRVELVIPEAYTTTFNGEQFLVFDGGANQSRILIFATRRNLQLLAGSDHWYMDGTFKTAPPLFEQLYTVHGIRYHNVVPAVFALLPDKSEDTYTRLIDQLKLLQPGIAPTSIMTDFERAAINATEAEFPNIQNRGCFYHFNQCIYRKIQSNGLQQRYNTDDEFALKMRLLPALAFVPTDHVVDAFNQLIETVQYPPETQPILDYFEDTWIGRPQRGNRRRPPLFARPMWNCYDAVVDGLPKTNNSVEGWHRGFSELIGHYHPTIWKFLNCLKLEQSRNEMSIGQYIAGQHPPPGKKKYRDCAERIGRIVNQYGQIDLLDYLRGLAHNYNF